MQFFWQFRKLKYRIDILLEHIASIIKLGLRIMKNLLWLKKSQTIDCLFSIKT